MTFVVFVRLPLKSRFTSRLILQHLAYQVIRIRPNITLLVIPLEKRIVVLQSRVRTQVPLRVAILVHLLTLLPEPTIDQEGVAKIAVAGHELFWALAPFPAHAHVLSVRCKVGSRQVEVIGGRFAEFARFPFGSKRAGDAAPVQCVFISGL